MTNGGIVVKQREVVLISFPYSDLSRTGKRPVVVLSCKKYNSKNEDIICCAITSNPREYSYSIEIKNSDFEDGSLPYNSRVKTNKIGTIHQNKILKHYGVLTFKRSKQIVETLNLQIEIEE